MQYAVQFDVTRWWPRSNEHPVEYWLSLFPTAPLFGMPWRFGAAEPGFAEAPPVPRPAPPREPAAKPKAKPAAKEDVEDAVVIKDAAPAPKPDTPDDLTLIKGVGPKMAERLNAKGITTFAQIAKWSKAKIAKMDADLGGIPGAIARQDWVGQARKLSA